MAAGPRYWFPVKRYGWGWGPPATWEGWAVLAAFVSARGRRIVLSIVLAGVCWLNGEPPGWRWGDK